MTSRRRGRRLWWLMRLFAWLPLPVATGIGAFLAGMITWVPLRYASAYRVVLINLLAAYPDMPMAEARRIGRQSVRELGRTLTEFAHVWNRPVEETLARFSHIHGEATFLKALASPRPVLLLSLHQGSWENINLYLGQKGDATVMYQPHPATLLDEVVKLARERTGCRLVPTNSRGVKEGLATMRAGGTLALLADHNPGSHANPYAPFFGHQVPTPALVGKLVRRYRPHLFVVSCYRGDGGINDIRVHFEPATEAENAEDDSAILGALNRHLARCISRKPTQYQWTYKRFKWRPGGRRLWYRQSLILLRRASRGEPPAALGLAPDDRGADTASAPPQGTA